jgi:hypothetical protein
VTAFWAVAFSAMTAVCFVAFRGARRGLRPIYVILGLLLIVFAVRDIVIPFAYNLGYWLGITTILATVVVFELERRSLFKKR